MGAAGQAVFSAPPRHLVLREIKYFRLNNSGMAIFHQILRNLALVHLAFFSEEIHSKALLEMLQGIDKMHTPLEFLGESLNFAHP